MVAPENVGQVPLSTALPILIRDNHWCAVTVHTLSRKVLFHDSLIHSGRHVPDYMMSIASRALAYVSAMCHSRGWTKVVEGSNWHVSSEYPWAGHWIVEAYCTAEDGQTNSNDCGVFMLSNVHLAFHDDLLRPSRKCRTQQTTIPFLRQSFFSYLREGINASIPVDGHPVGAPMSLRVPNVCCEFEINEDQLARARIKLDRLRRCRDDALGRLP